MYDAMYKCRLCGKVFTRSGTNSEKHAVAEIAQLCRGERGLVEINRPHNCGNGDIGLGDFIGFQERGNRP